MPYIIGDAATKDRAFRRIGQRQMFRLLKIIFYLAVLLAAVVVGYAYLGDLTPPRDEIVEPVELDAG